MLLPQLAWKTHRFLLKRWPFWSPLRVDNRRFRVRYLAEGTRCYLFTVAGDSQHVLRISKRHFYGGLVAANPDRMAITLRLYQELAARQLAPAMQLITGEAALVDRIAARLVDQPGLRDTTLAPFFRALECFSLETSQVILDFAENNFGLREGRLVLLDLDPDFIWPLPAIADCPLVQRRLGQLLAASTPPADILHRFYECEQLRLRATLESNVGGSAGAT